MRRALLLTALLATPGLSAGIELAYRPAYGAAESLSDGVYGVLRANLMGSLLPGRLSSRMSDAPERSSYEDFAREMKRRQERASRRITESAPTGLAATPAALLEWRRRAAAIQTGAVTDAFAKTMIRRYQLEAFGRESGEYVKDGGNWDAELLASTLLLGGAYLYAAGLRTDWRWGPVRVDFDTARGPGLRSALRGGTGTLAALRLSPAAGGVSVGVDAGLRQGRPSYDRAVANWSTRF